MVVNVRLLYEQLRTDFFAKCYDFIYSPLTKEDINIEELIKFLDANKIAYLYMNEFHNLAQINWWEGK